MYKNTIFSTRPYMDSDHLPVTASFLQLSQRPSAGCMLRWKFRTDDWAKYMKLLQDSIDCSALPLQEAAQVITHTLETAGRHAFHLTTHRMPRCPGKPWRNDECTKAIKARRRVWNRWRKTPTILAGIEYRHLDAICNRIIVQAKRKSWHTHCSSLSFSSSSRQTWDFIHSMEGEKTKQNLPLKLHNNPLLDDPQKTELLAINFFAKIGCHPNLHPPTDFHEVINNATLNPVIQELDQPFTEKEIDEAIAALKPRKTVGHDLIPYEFLTHLIPLFKKAFLNIYNSSWHSGDLLSCWKKSVVLPILKSGKNPTSPSSDRPISLLSCFGKLLDRLACTRLSWWLEEKQLLKEEKCGFRPRRGTLDILAQIEYPPCLIRLCELNPQDMGTILHIWADKAPVQSKQLGGIERWMQTP